MSKFLATMALAFAGFALPAQTFTCSSIFITTNTGTTAVDRGPSTVDHFVSPLYIQQPEVFFQPQWTKPLPGARKKISGMIMVGMGAALQAGGILLIREQRYRDRHPTPVCSSCKPADSGTIGILGGMALLGGTGLATTGTILWWKGSIRLNEARDARQARALQINVGPTPSLSYQF